MDKDGKAGGRTLAVRMIGNGLAESRPTLEQRLAKAARRFRDRAEAWRWEDGYHAADARLFDEMAMLLGEVSARLFAANADATP